MRSESNPPRDLRAPAAAAAAALAGVLLLLASCPAFAQDLDAQLFEIRTLLREKRYPLALEGLRFTARRIQELRLAEIRTVFPAAPEGWSTEEPLALLHEEDLWEHRLEARAAYRRADGAAKIEITVDLNSPHAPSAALEFNPVVVAADPQARLVEVGKQKGRLRFNPDTGSGEIRLLIGNRTLITVAGRGLTGVEEILSLARALDFVLLAERAGI